MPAGIWVRAGAMVLDGLVLVALRLFLTLGAGSGVGANGLGFLLGLAYATATVGAWGQSLGHMAAGVKVVRAEDGGPLGYGKAAVRAVVALFSSLLLGVGYLIAPFNARKRTLHDFAAGSVAVYPEPVAFARRAAMAALGAGLFVVPLLLAGWLAGSATGRTLFSRASGLGALELKSKEGATKGNLGSLRAALAIYYGDHEGVYPQKPQDLLEPSGPSRQPALAAIPFVQVKDHPASSEVEVYGAEVCAPDGASVQPQKLRDTGKWGFVAAKGSPCDGRVFVDCTHADTKGVPWYSY